MSSLSIPSEANDYRAEHVGLLLASLQRLTGLRPVSSVDSMAAAKAVWEAPFALVSHGIEADPVFNYGNRTALSLFEMDWDAFVGLPSRFSAEAPNRDERQSLLQRVAAHGFIDDYTGIRIAASGRRFRIEQAVVWNITNTGGLYLGQAAMFDQWSMLTASKGAIRGT